MDYYIAIIIYGAVSAKSKQISIVKWRAFVYFHYLQAEDDKDDFS
jgi:hypothetical protein